MDHYYVLSRFLICRMLTVTKIPYIKVRWAQTACGAALLTCSILINVVTLLMVVPTKKQQSAGSLQTAQAYQLGLRASSA